MTHPNRPDDRPEDWESGPGGRPNEGPLRFEGGPAGGPPEPGDAPYVLDRLAVLTHEMSNLLDGSLRMLELARRAVDRSTQEGESPPNELGQALRRIEIVQTSMTRMAELVTASMQPAASSIGTSLLGPSSPVTTAEAIEHAIAVVRPIADDRGVEIETRIAAPAGEAIAGPVYTVILNALHNALDAIELATDRDGMVAGSIDILVRLEPPMAPSEPEQMIIEIKDDGAGLPMGTPSQWLFDHGATTKEDGHGIGLALAQSVVHELGGVIELAARPERMGETRPGAILRVSYPMPTERHAPLGREER